MKHVTKLFYFLLFTVVISSCKKDEIKNYYEGGTAPVLTANKATTIGLKYDDRDLEAVKFNWTNPNYQFTTGISSQDVSYVVEIDKNGANFTSANKQSVSISKDLSLTITQNQLNDYLLNQLQLPVSTLANIQVRVVASLNGAVKLISNALNYAVTPYAIPPKVAPPASGKLFIVGNATPGGDATGWNNPVPVPSQQFTVVTPTIYELTINLNGGKSYLLLPVNGDWSDKYGFDGSNNANNPDVDNLKRGGGDILSPAAAGRYKIQVDFQRGKFTLTKLP